jgi:N-acylneuraminate cytidylyltransferase
MTNRLAIIPARGGSKRIPDKNIREFCGKPILMHILESAIKSSLFDKIHVSTESRKIAKILKDNGYEIDFFRPKKLADDFTPILQVLYFVLDRLQVKYDEVWLLTSTAALLNKKDLLDISNTSNKSKKKLPMLGVGEFPIPIDWAFRMNNEGTLSALNPEYLNKRSQDIEKKYYDAGLFCVFSNQNLTDLKEGKNLDYNSYLLPKYKAIDIDEEDDWLIAEALFKKNN